MPKFRVKLSDTRAAKTTLKTLIKLPHWGQTHDCRVIGSVWVACLLFAHTRPICPTHFAGNPYPARITATITPIYFIGSSYMSDLFLSEMLPI